MSADTNRYQHLRERLEAERDNLTQEVQNLQNEVASFAGVIANEDRSYGNHMADDATETYEAERRLALERNLQTVLGEVEHSLQRMDAGTYGSCEVCGKEIPIERLEAIPHATRCVEDQARGEQRR